MASELFEQALRILLQVTEEEQSLEVADLLYKIASCHEVLCEYDEGKLLPIPVLSESEKHPLTLFTAIYLQLLVYLRKSNRLDKL